MVGNSTISWLARGALLVVAVAPALAGTETATRTVTREDKLVTGSALVVENLLGSMEVEGGGTPGTVRVEARIVVDSDSKEQAESVAASFDWVRREAGGETVLHVAWPTDRYTLFRTPKSESSVLQRFLAPLVKRDKLSVEYDGKPVEIGSVKGALPAAVHVKVVVPTEVAATFRQVAGTLRAARLRGALRLESVAASIDVNQVYVGLSARTGGGEVRIHTFKGDRLEIESGSADVSLDDVQAKEASLRSTSGAIRGSGMIAGKVDVRSGSGDVELADVDPASVHIETESGGVELASRLKSTHRAEIRTGTGDVTLRVGDVTPFTVNAKTTSGSVSAHGIADLKVVEQAKNAAVYRRGSGGVDVEIVSGKGGVTVAAIR